MRVYGVFKAPNAYSLCILNSLESIMLNEYGIKYTERHSDGKLRWQVAEKRLYQLQ